MYKVLVFGMTENYGGVESVITNYYKRFDHNKIHFDFICNMMDEIAYEKELREKYNCKFFKTVRKRENIIKYYAQLNHIFSKISKEYDCLWFNVNNLVNIDCLKLAKKYRIKKIIAHSHNSQIMEEGLEGKVKNFLHNKHKKCVANYATDFWTCSSEAAEWLFPSTILSKVYWVKNAINIKKNEYSLSKRNYIRNKYNLDRSYVIGNVGRLHFQKNQMFMLDILVRLQNKMPNIKLVLVGNGPDKDKLIKRAKELNVFDKVIFTGMQHDMQAWYSSFDLFLFPSLFEGLSIALLEAQANGLVIASSSSVPEDVKVNPNLHFLSLNKKVEYWAEKIQKFSQEDKRLSNKQIESNFNQKGYNIDLAARKLEKKFLE